MTSTDTDTEAPVEVDTTPDNVVHLSATQLADAVAMVKPHVGNDSTLRILSTYQLAVRDAALWIAATDRYSAAAARIAPVEKNLDGLRQMFPARFCAVIPSHVITHAGLIFKPNRREPLLDPQLTIRVHGDQVVIEERADSGIETTRLAAMGPDKEPPDILELLHTCLTAVRGAKERIDHSGFHANLLNRFAGVPKFCDQGSLTPLVLRQAAGNKPLVVTCGESFLGALMPVRLADGQVTALDVWLKRLAPKKASK